jgi:hypothetical protein
MTPSHVLAPVAAILVLALVACGKPSNPSGGSQGAPEAQPPQEPAGPSPNPAPASTPPPGTLALDTGEATFGVTPVAGSSAFAATLATQNQAATTPGTLGLSLELFGADDMTHPLFLADPAPFYRTPAKATTSIASGTPDELVVYVTRIELTTVTDEELAKQEKKGDKEDGGPVSLKEQHVARFTSLSEEKKAALTALVGKVYEGMDAFMAAVIGATGLTGDELKTIMEPVKGELAAASTSDGSKTATLFANDAGAPMKMANGQVDLAALFADGKTTFAVKPGTYNTVRIQYLTKAQVKGCVRMNFECRSGAAGTNNTCAALPTADVPGSQGVAGSPPVSSHLYCTRAAKAPYVAGTQNSDFEVLSGSPNPELMDFPLTERPDKWETEKSFTIDYRVAAPVTVKAGDKIDLSLVVDLNRMLRYYNRGRQDQGITGDAPKDKAYFFTTVFRESTFAFIGKPGRIYGYEMFARVCGTSESADFTNAKCSTSGKPLTSTDLESVPFWMTIITAADGKPLTLITQPDDDNDLTITKGTIREITRCPSDRRDDNTQIAAADLATRPKGWLRGDATDATRAVIHYGLCGRDPDGKAGSSEADYALPQAFGRYIGFPKDLEVVPPLADGPGVADVFANDASSITGVRLRAESYDPSNGSHNFREGVLTIKRRL